MIPIIKNKIGWVELHKTTKLKIFMRKQVLCYCECLESMEGSFLLNSAFDPSTLEIIRKLRQSLSPEGIKL